jgi:hypothetical protein
MERFIARENIRRFKEQLRSCRDEPQKATLRKLLSEEERKLGTLGKDAPRAGKP